MKGRLLFGKKEVYPDGSLTDIRIWHVRKSPGFPTGVKYAFYLIGPVPGRTVIVGYDNHHRKGHHRHEGVTEAPVDVTSVSALLLRFRDEVARYLKAKGIELD